MFTEHSLFFKFTNNNKNNLSTFTKTVLHEQFFKLTRLQRDKGGPCSIKSFCKSPMYLGFLCSINEIRDLNSAYITRSITTSVAIFGFYNFAFCMRYYSFLAFYGHK